MQYSGYQAPHIVKQWGAYFRSILDVLLGTFDPSPSEIVGCLDKIYFRYCSFNGYDDVQYDIYYVENCRKSLCTPACIYNFSFNFLNLFILCKYMSSGPSAPCIVILCLGFFKIKSQKITLHLCTYLNSFFKILFILCKQMHSGPPSSLHCGTMGCINSFSHLVRLLAVLLLQSFFYNVLAFIFIFQIGIVYIHISCSISYLQIYKSPLMGKELFFVSS